MKKYIYLLFLPILFFSCESLEDTYSEFYGDGPDRYVGKCNDFSLEYGWERFRFNWTNSVDPTAEKVVILWESEEEKDSVVLDFNKDVTTYLSERVFTEDKTYNFSIYIKNSDGLSSLKEKIYGIHPINGSSAILSSFQRVELKHYYVKDNLILILNSKNEEIKKSTLHYTDINGNNIDKDFTDDDYAQKYLVINNVDITKSVNITRNAEIAKSFDEIDFEPYELEKDIFFIDSDMALDFEGYYQLSDIDFDFVKSTTELYLDASVKSLADLLYFTNLKTLYLGAHSYKDFNFLDDALASVVDMPLSLFVLEQLHDVLGVDIKVYNNIYELSPMPSFVENLDNPALPELNYFDTTNWTVKCSTTLDGDGTHPENILDNDSQTTWTPISGYSSEARVHEFTIDMKNSNIIKGAKFVQSANSNDNEDYFPDFINIQYSNDKIEWKEALVMKQFAVRKGHGESNLVYFNEPINARYIRMSVTDQYNGYEQKVIVGDFVLFGE